MTMIEARGLSKVYAGVPVIEDVSFTLAAGSRTALVGANGAGKSTLLQMLTSLVLPTAGEAHIDGRPATTPEARHRVGVLSHRPMLYEELTPLENLRFFAGLYEVPNPGVRIEELLRTVGLWQRRHEQTAVLSRGYHQRLSMARAVLHRPPVLLLDEPETGLDQEGLALLDELMLRASGVTVLAATHRLDRVPGWAEATLTVERGGVVGPDAVAATASAATAAASTRTPTGTG